MNQEHSPILSKSANWLDSCRLRSDCATVKGRWAKYIAQRFGLSRARRHKME